MNQGLLEPWPGQVRLGAAGGCAEVAVMKDTGARRRTPAGGHSPHSPDLSVGTVTHRATASAPCRTRSTQRRSQCKSLYLDSPRYVPRNLILTMITHNISFEFYFNIYFFMFLFVSADPSKSAHKILYHPRQLLLKCLMLHAFDANTAYFHNRCFLTTVPPKSK